jgi:predicted Rossmann fold nucleotide-binding protein DprA/Smf involved in DNA uptake
MTETEQIVASIDDRLRQLGEEIRTLTAARAALDGRDAAATRRRHHEPTSESSPPAPEKSRVRAKPRRARKRRPAEVASAGRLELLLSEHGEMTTSALAEHAGGTRDQVLAALRELEAAGRVRRSGQRRSTRWHAITDEERIQKRAAELAALSKTAV